jgi:hypothetical protein
VKYYILIIFFIFLNHNLFSQRGGADEWYDSEAASEQNRYAHLGLSTGEWISIIVGIVCLLIARNIKDSNKGASKVFWVIGGLASIPMLLVITAVVGKLLGYALILATIIGILYALFNQK